MLRENSFEVIVRLLRKKQTLFDRSTLTMQQAFLLEKLPLSLINRGFPALRAKHGAPVQLTAIGDEGQVFSIMSCILVALYGIGKSLLKTQIQASVFPV
ncbi:hypothetical protein AB835_01620 [Candidatus Endobugula sertula]|uniref:Uncharacterized protein n=1 Tax=Candidatus Endobugula sertula TaxID=62101 RepID=A0A1D2QT63_9GAMM|nr:hypothetical protein AB835_01620 [Candidatus Endobugula sertula]